MQLTRQELKLIDNSLNSLNRIYSQIRMIEEREYKDDKDKELEILIIKIQNLLKSNNDFELTINNNI